MTKSAYLQSKVYKELWKIRNPSVSPTPRTLKELRQQAGKPLSRRAVFELTTGRNRNLITATQQDKLRQTNVAFYGMSVGSHAALTWLMESRADIIKIVDPDTIDASNLNRIRFGWSQVGKYKIDAVAKLLKDMHPECQVVATTDISVSSLTSISIDFPTAHIIVDEIDDFESKILLRRIAKNYHLPLISAADVGDNIVLDIERHDLDSSLTPFLGRIPEWETIDFTKMTDMERRKMIIRVVGFEQNSEAMLNSLFAIGGSIPTWPQLGATATISGGLITTTIKKIVLGESVVSGRYYLSLDDLLVSNFNTPERKSRRDTRVSQIKNLLKLN